MTFALSKRTITFTILYPTKITKENKLRQIIVSKYKNDYKILFFGIIPNILVVPFKNNILFVRLERNNNCPF